ncbi:MAG: molybdenum cofactor biosynthesis protein MoaE [Desulfobacterium sp.]|nr:molybdenum cofactor biosynthesis protein MoaE [Desulfobacterium sp.]MBU3949689.1 molybdenum cofactor biosynthesis protein MoaE [Pseudomonadota bacterium]MBU4035417.1 molybdenum cofactor biosynthesis protein MoaE [Pseudomonadota bacterium]
MSLDSLVDTIKKHPDYDKVGMILCHNGVVRGTSRDGRKVSGIRVAVDHAKLKKIIDASKNKPGIVEVLVKIFEDKDLGIGDDVMYLAVAGDIRENVIMTLQDTLNEIKTTVTAKTEYFI